ncbi:hypothetical protein TTHERM_000723569 (macronuclear) [Tetrahymena thermophila SB210]|uniref:Uncharacterized protein n=1 Tax=Tetrahymena thermophila (strain SB210) TaxID=312017 RepID=W7XFT0_TETTS|nr:hypothetical protein TTHERM_000723569 [Tetrahymena thermophila SB210]EWS71679.1 hypothetical protein TTHERM_000723569 [Tetrahymena thermophila SB210]|eukprot:XP_012655790.1 hypothetical protein TTHERM_000723569 [Tetrahymena thermophila SB210]
MIIYNLLYIVTHLKQAFQDLLHIKFIRGSPFFLDGESIKAICQELNMQKQKIQFQTKLFATKAIQILTAPNKLKIYYLVLLRNKIQDFTEKQRYLELLVNKKNKIGIMQIILMKK